MAEFRVRYSNGIPNLTRELAGRLHKVASKTAFDVKANAINRIQTGPKTGRVYKRGKKLHQASAAGESPATDTGLLVSSITVRHTAVGEATVGVGAEYAQALEYGNAAKGLEPRPFLRPALEENVRKFRRAVELVLGGARP